MYMCTGIPVAGATVVTIMNHLLVLLVLLSGALCVCSSKHHVGRSSFPSNFVFGTASSAYQYEGATAEGGREPSIWDSFSHTPGNVQDGSNGDVAVDQYHRYKEDVGHMKELGVDAYRFSISWSRVLPHGKPNHVNSEGVAYYNNLINELLSHDITPYITLSHWDLPQALEDSYLGWLSSQIVDDFAAYADLCFGEFGDRVKHWITLNEPHIIANFAYNLGVFPPKRCSAPSCTAGNSSTEPYIVAHHFILSHAAAVKIYKSKYQIEQRGIIGASLDAIWFEPFSSASKDKAAAKRAREFNLGWFLEPLVYGDYPSTLRERVGNRLPSFTEEEKKLLKGMTDFVGINHYYTLYAADLSSNVKPIPFNEQAYTEDVQVQFTDTKNGLKIGNEVNGFYSVPYGMKKLLNHIRKRYGNPAVYITENGISDSKQDKGLQDEVRIGYLRKYLAHVVSAIRDGCNVKGYFAWSLLDNWEWNRGFAVKFGLYHVDYANNLTRTPKQSARWYKGFLAV